MSLVLPSIPHIGLFLTASVVLLLIPGPAVLYIVGRSTAQGRMAGLVSVLGIHAGTLAHVAAAAVGLSAILLASSLAFELVKYAGAAYLVWLGLRRLLMSERPDSAKGRARPGHWQLFRDGFVVNLLNPKIALFFLAFLPQFVDPALGDIGLQIASLGVIFVGIGLLSDSAYAVAAGAAGNWLRQSRGWIGFERYVSGGLFIALGLFAASASK